jgi:hypothetical protein
MATPAQLQNVGPQDRDLTFQPSVSFFRRQYRRHTPYAQEPIEIPFTINPRLGKTGHVVIPRNADLLTKLYLVIDVPALKVNGEIGGAGAMYTNDVARAMIESITLEKASVVHDTLYPEFLHAWEELSVPEDRHLGPLTGKCKTDSKREKWARNSQRFYVPLEFYFQRDMAHAIPLVAMHMTDIKIKVALKSKEKLFAHEFVEGDNVKHFAESDIDMFLLGEYVYLGEDERRWFAQQDQEYLVTQNQHFATTLMKGEKSKQVDLHFNHPVKELIFMFRTETSEARNEWFNFSMIKADYQGRYQEHPFESMALTINNSDRIQKRDPLYFGVLQPYEHHTRVPHKGIYVFSFAASPESSSPSGSINLSRVENVRMNFTFDGTNGLPENTTLLVFARNKNVVTVGSGVSKLHWAS